MLRPFARGFEVGQGVNRKKISRALWRISLTLLSLRKKWAYYSQSIITVFETEHDLRSRMNNLKQQYKDINSPTIS